jgi:alanyl-tRNA synthetase
MNSTDLRKKFLQFFEGKGHKIIPSSTLVPENDPTVLFTTAGMHPLVPYLLGQQHPEGKRLANVQKCLRTDDIEEVGDGKHLTFFQMLGNWSLGDYWKEEAIAWSYEFLTDPKWLNINKERLAVSVFAGDNDAPEDTESIAIWKNLGIPDERIAKLSKKDNWWGPPGTMGPCGPDTEMFYWTGSNPVPVNFDPKNENWVEIWNDVFM